MLARRRRRRPPMGQVSSSCLGQPISCHCILPQYQGDSLGGGGLPANGPGFAWEKVLIWPNAPEDV